MRNGSAVHRLWWHCTDKDWLGVAWKAWRPYCWVRGYHLPHHMDVYFEHCVVCCKPLWSRKCHGGPNPIARVERLPCSWRADR
jgi:hypothetical protein